ncbi:hypothetical protein [Sulfurimonas sp.]|uniref:hypothetical protein n=1 Tax=Sulfurimonas sp. TaxID=2022749 RepID=UPI002B49F540|nr:hypothetical protein [Sulfurimonas sp.]
MNRINPLYLGLFFIVLIIFISFKLSSSKSELTELKEAYKESLKLSTELSSLKKVYTKKVNLASLRSVSVVQKRTETGATLSSVSMSFKELNSLMSRILNGAYNITGLKIKKLSATKVSLYLEIKW